MRKKNVVLYTVIVLALTMVISPLVVAKPETRLNGDAFIALSDGTVPFPGYPPGYYCSFVGTVSGDINGILYIHLIEAWFPAPGVEHFTEYWRIEPDSGGHIEGYNKGKWTMSNFKWLANGEVTGASTEYDHLIGSKWQYGGTTNDPFGTDPIVGNGKFHITHNK